MMGLHGVGKTTIMYKIQAPHLGVPVIGFSVEQFVFKSAVSRRELCVTLWDTPGQGFFSNRIRPLWPHYLERASGMIYVVDATDRERIGDAREEVQLMLLLSNNEKHVRDPAPPLLVLANKVDLPTAMSVAELTDKLGLHAVLDRRWFVQATSAISGEGIGLHEGFEWLSAEAVQS
jgi:ADP-ribosylation factor protein 1